MVPINWGQQCGFLACSVDCSALFAPTLLGLHEQQAFTNLLSWQMLLAVLWGCTEDHRTSSSAEHSWPTLSEGSCHYPLHSLIWSIPTLLQGVFSQSCYFHAATYTKKVLDAKGSNSLPLLRSSLNKLSTNQQNILKFIACNETQGGAKVGL